MRINNYKIIKEEDTNNVTFLQSIEGGKVAPDGEGPDDWVSKLKLGQVVLIKPKADGGPFLTAVQVIFKTDTETKFVDMSNQPVYFWVANMIFANTHRLIKTLGYVYEDENAGQQKEEDQPDRPVQPEGLEDTPGPA